MGKKFFNKHIIIVFSILIVIANLLAFTIPLASGNKIRVNQSVSTRSFEKLYQIKLEEGKIYTIIVTIDPVWKDDYSITLFNSYLLLSGKRVNTASYSGERFEFKANKTGKHFFRLNNRGFGDLIVRNGSYGSTANPVEVSGKAKRAVLFFLPEIIVIIPFLFASLISFQVRKQLSWIERIDQMASSPSTSALANIRKIPLTNIKTEEERIEDLRSIIKRYKRISLDELTKLLDFTDRIALQDWLIDLPESVGFQIDNNMIIIPRNLQSDTNEAKETITTLAKSLTQLQAATCYSCGEPLSDEPICGKCGEETLKCMVCKLPISLGEDIGKCSLCESIAHLSHFQEWLKVKGICPHCLQKIPPEGIVPTTKSIKK